MNKSGSYYLIWNEELEIWFYLDLVEWCRFREVLTSYTEYCVEVANGIIIDDEYKTDNKGKDFDTVYGKFFNARVIH